MCTFSSLNRLDNILSNLVEILDEGSVTCILVHNHPGMVTGQQVVECLSLSSWNYHVFRPTKHKDREVVIADFA